jgi:1,4-dihydroxy-2-naphthoate octaprenyltransferase
MVFTAITNTTLSETLNSNMLYAAMASTFLIGGVYPLTQIYQHKADLENGDITISYKLGYKGTFIFTIIMFVMANLLLLQYFTASAHLTQFYIFQIMLLPVVIVFLNWFIKVIKDTKNADFEHTMRMNTMASCCMNACFIVLLLLNIN